ncbi:AAA family ATPase [Bifidobacterium mongoliense]|uniref:AAA family ATPase n=1 Tax=Bifidobacterium mongoliense TaxID=518643 RepID=UPI0030EC3E96
MGGRMKLRVDGVGKIRHTEIELNGITVIAGPNNTGKSTLGKTLFALVNAQKDFSNNVFADIVESVQDALLGYLDSLGRFPIAYDANIRSLPRILTKTFITASSVDSAMISRWLKKQAASAMQDDSSDAENDEESHIFVGRKLSKTKLSEIYKEMAGRKAAALSFRKKCAAIFGRKTAYFRSKFAQTEFQGVFQSQPISLIKGSDMKASVSLIDDSSAALLTSKVVFADGRCTLAAENLGEQYNVLMLDSPNDITYLLDDGAESNSRYWSSRARNRWWVSSSTGSLIEDQTRRIISSGAATSASLLNGSGKDSSEDLVGNILKLLNTAHSGSVGKDSDGRLVMNEPDIDVVKPLMLANASMGVKSVELLKELLRRGVIGKNTFLVLDEPEIHLHPEWQLIYARALVMMARELGVKILVTTHSPYFAEALYVYSKKLQIDGLKKVYVPNKNEDGSVTYQDRSGIGESEIFDDMAKPFEDLEKVQASIDEGCEEE